MKLFTEARRIMVIALPLMGAQVAQMSMGVVDAVMAGQYSSVDLAGVALGGSLFWPVMMLMMGLVQAVTPTVAQLNGAQRYSDIGEVIRQGLWLALFGGAMAVVLLNTIGPVYTWLEVDPDAAAISVPYLHYTSFGVPALMCFFCLRFLSDGVGYTRPALYISVLALLLKIPLNYALIYGVWGAPEMGVAGVAIAAGISFTIGTGVLLMMWIRQKFRVKHVGGGWWRRERLRALLNIGFPAALEQGVFQVGFFIFLMLIGNYYGTEAFAAYNIGVNILAVCMTVGFGFSIAGSTLVGQHLGANDHDGAARSGWMSLFYAVLSMGGLGVLIIIFANELTGLLLGEDEPLTIAYTVQFTYMLGAMMPLLAVDFAIGGALRGAGDTRFPLMATALGLLGMRCGLAALATYLDLPVVYVYASLIGDYVLKGTLLVWRFHRGKWKTLVSSESLGLKT